MTKARKRKCLVSVILGLLVWFYFCLPKQLFDTPYSTVLESESGMLLGARIASDGQWRFPQVDTLPEKFEKCIVYFEDRYFFKHFGINPLAIARAIKQNIQAKRIVSGGSTLSAQVLRLARTNKKRTIGQKCIEFILAMRLELRYSKKEILSLYSAHAPFGGNVVGLEAAAWRYYGRKPDKLSWAESATLAVLPNAPSMIFPGKNHDRLLQKRNRLLDKLCSYGEIDQITCDLAKSEALPGRPHALPNIAPHLITRIINDGKSGQRIRSTIDAEIQNLSNITLNKHHQQLKQNGIMHGAILVVEVESGKVLAYVGNALEAAQEPGGDVDIIPAPRSSGSTLKPLLYALMQEGGSLLPHSLVPDIPTRIARYMPQNFDKTFQGAAPASVALARSLNIPAVRMLRRYGVERFTTRLKNFGFSTITQSPDHYGLSLILGGSEVSLWDLSKVYAAMAHNLNYYSQNNSVYDENYRVSYDLAQPGELVKLSPWLGAGASFLTFEALTEMDRPDEGAQWRRFRSANKIAWKTGTSFGFRDAWVIGITPKHVVAVWTGNANGLGRPDLTGVKAAAPIMFDVFRFLPSYSWFATPYDDLTLNVVCRASGYKASNICVDVDSIWTCVHADKSSSCPYHRIVHLDAKGTHQVHADCYPAYDMVSKPWFVLPPAMEQYYKRNHLFYASLPPIAPDCMEGNTQNMDIIYPPNYAKLYIPKSIDQKRQKVVFELAHRITDAKVYWHLDDHFLGVTQKEHTMAIDAEFGSHKVTLIDEYGETLVQSISIIEK